MSVLPKNSYGDYFNSFRVHDTYFLISLEIKTALDVSKFFDSCSKTK